MTAADTLRHAATVLRQAAEQATDGRWSFEEDADTWELYAGRGQSHGLKLAKCKKRDQPYAEYWPNEADSTYLTLVDPAVGLALADWLDKAAEVYEAEVHEGYGVSLKRLTPALDVARAILREESGDG